MIGSFSRNFSFVYLNNLPIIIHYIVTNQIVAVLYVFVDIPPKITISPFIFNLDWFKTNGFGP